MGEQNKERRKDMENFFGTSVLSVVTVLMAFAVYIPIASVAAGH